MVTAKELHENEGPKVNTTKQHLIDAIRHRTGIPTLQIYETVTQLLQVIGEKLAKGQKIELRRFGTFAPVTRKARNGVRNPSNGAPCPQLPERRVAVFRPASGLKQAVDAGPVQAMAEAATGEIVAAMQGRQA